MYIIGIDCAVEEKKTGLAQLYFNGEAIRLLKAEKGSRTKPAVAVIEDWIEEATQQGSKVLLCFDAPLGWPKHFGESLNRHQAGTELQGDIDSFFRRRTDNVVHQLLGKRPLDVTASFIARTAFRALKMIGSLQGKFGSVEFVWDIRRLEGIGCIEVYPAAWLRSEGISHEKYKQQSSVRRDIVNELQKQISMDPGQKEKLIASDHVLDALLSGLNGVDFAENRCISPDEMNVEENTLLTEGWIWVKPGDQQR